MTHQYKKDFPVFEHHPELVYLDTAATALVPRPVIAAINEYYEQYPANIHRGLYDLSATASQKYESARNDIAQFIGADEREVIFTAGTTASINMLALMLESALEPGDVIVLTRFEHHANLLPWQQLAKKHRCELRFIELTSEYDIDMASLHAVLDQRVKIVAFSMMSNTLGTIAPATAIIDAAKAVGAITVCDAAQIIAHMPLDVRALDCDFLAFSGHKLYGPTGVGVLYGKQSVLEKLEPVFVGGDMVREVSYASATWADAPTAFEAGTPDIAGVIGLGAAVRYLTAIGWGAIVEMEHRLTAHAVECLKNMPGVRIIGPEQADIRGAVISFVIDGVHPHDIAQIMSDRHIAVRAGHHCTMPLMRHLGLSGTARVSFGIYSTEADINRFIEAIQVTQEIFCTKK